MKKFVLYFFVAVIGWSLVSCCNSSTTDTPVCPIKRGADSISVEPSRPAGQSDVIGLRCDPIPTVRVAFIGLGMRGPGAVSRFMHIEGIEVKAICDLEQYNIDKVQEMLKKDSRPEASVYTGEEDWKKVCERDDIDLVYVCTPWFLHTPMAVYAMEHGKHVAVEVPIARTMDECWQLVNTAEKTRRHCIQLENCCYDFFEMATLNMAQKGLFGEVVHVEGAYIHDLRSLNFNPRLNERESYEPGIGDTKSKRPGLTGYWNYWRLTENTDNNGNIYPTHGLGPVCQVLNIHRGDRMERLVSLSSDQFNMSAYAKTKFGDDSPEAGKEYREGDMNTTLVKTAKGKSILIQHDVASPRPYSRIHMISGTKGFAQKWPAQQLAFDPEAHSALSREDMEKKLKEYEHPITREVGELARKVGGHGGMDFIMDYRLVYCLRNGLPLDMDVYDAAEWSCITPLSEFSVAHGSVPVKVPDFTRGAWQKIQGFQHAFK
ncbi:MAG: Gfo/Idh/MocA family oxidoreductase [Bacteroidales bacterium]|nr:Gfo/Idh/MocA family oxidoreductase [Bacteroidales bacterium]